MKNLKVAQSFNRLQGSQVFDLVLGGGAVAIALFAQWTLVNRENVAATLLLYFAALNLALLAVARELTPAVAPESASTVFTSAPTRWFFFIASLLFTLGAFGLNTDASFLVQGVVQYQFTAVGVLSWLASVICFFAAFWQPEKSWDEWRTLLRARVENWRGGFALRANWKTLALIAILALGAFFYFYRLDAIPAEMTSDHVEKLLDVNDVLEGHPSVFFTRNTGREPFQFYLTTAIILITHLPLGHLALKLGTATTGWLTILATYFLARELFDELVGLFAAFFMAVSHWMVTIARMGLRFPFTPFFAALTFLFVVRALKYQKRNDWLLAGLMMGIGIYTYIPSRGVPLVVLALCAVWAWFEGARRKTNWRAFAVNVALMFGLMLIVFAPLLRYAIDYPDQFWFRAVSRVEESQTLNLGNVAGVLVSNLRNLALMFNWKGDGGWPNNIPEQPALDSISSALLVLGVGLALFRAGMRRTMSNVYVLIAFVALLIPSALVIAYPIENPSNVRAGGAIPFIAILVALPLALFVRALKTNAANVRFGRVLAWAIILLFLMPIVAQNYDWYFVKFDLSYRESAQNTSEAAAVIRAFASSIGDIQHAYHVAYPYWFDSRALAIQIGDVRWQNYSLDARDFFSDTPNDANLLFIVNRADVPNLQRLTAHFPNGQVFTVQSRTPGKDFIVFFVPALR